MINSLKKDLILTFSQKSIKIMFLLYIPFLLICFGNVGSQKIYVASVFLFTYVLALTPFTYDTNLNTIQLIASLPITKYEIVIYKYMNTFIYLLLSILYSAVYLWILDKLNIINFTHLSSETLIQIIIIILLYVSIIFPLNFKFAPNIARILSIILFCIWFIVVLQNIGTSNGITHYLISHNITQYKLLTISFIVYILSSLISIKLYETRDW